MNAPQKTDFAYFRNEILGDMKGKENKINEKIAELNKYIERINTSNGQKLDKINSKIRNIQENMLLEDKINAKFDKINHNFEENIYNLGTKINMVKKDLSDACFKYDQIVIDNLKVTGLIGDGGTFPYLKNFLDFINKKITELLLEKEKVINEIKLIKIKIDDIKSQFKSDFENQKIVINDMLAIRLNEEERKNQERNFTLEKKIENLKLENYNSYNNLIKSTKDLQIQCEKFENIDTEINEKLNEEKINLKINSDNLVNAINSQKKEFNFIKSRFKEMNNIFKQFSKTRLSQNFEAFSEKDIRVRKKELLQLSKKQNFDKNQNINKSDLEITSKEEKNSTKLEIEENNIINEKQIEENKITLSDNQNKEDSNYINNINLKEKLIDNQEENKMEDNEEKQKELDLENNNINKNNRKNFIKENNSNSVENKNIYTKITIKSLNKKSKDDSTNNVNDANEDINLEKEKHEIPFETNIKNGEINNFSKTLTKNIFLNLKKGNKSLKKINFNKSNERREKKENEKISFQKNNTKKHLLKSEHEKFHEYLSLSNEIKSFNHHTNTTPLNLKLKNIINKKGQKNKEEILPLNLENFLSNENNEKENKYFKRIIEYINMTNHNINEKFQNISAQIGNDISSIKKEINQIYNDANLVTLNNNNRVRKLAPFKIKINNFDLYNNSGIQLNMENFKNFKKNSFIRNKSGDKNLNSEDTPKNILNSIEPYLIKKFKDKVL